MVWVAKLIQHFDMSEFNQVFLTTGALLANILQEQVLRGSTNGMKSHARLLTGIVANNVAIMSGFPSL